MLGFGYEGIQFLQGFTSPLLTLLFTFVTSLGSPLAWVFVSAVLYWSGKRDESFFAVNVIALSAVFVGAGKLLLQNARPSSDVVSVFFPEKGYSFPSGHATIASAQAFVFNKFTKGRFLLAFIAVAVLVALSRMYLGVHFLEDVLGGLALGVVVGWIAWKSFTSLEKKVFKAKLSRKALTAAFLALAFALLFAQLSGVEESADVLVFAGILVGYYLGLLTSKSEHVHVHKTHHFFARNFTGLLVLTLLSAASLQLAVQNAYLGVFGALLAGYWITFAYPWVIEKVLKT